LLTPLKHKARAVSSLHKSSDSTPSPCHHEAIPNTSTILECSSSARHNFPHKHNIIPQTRLLSPQQPMCNHIVICLLLRRTRLSCHSLDLITVNITKVSACRAACEDNSACESFSHIVRTGPCQLYFKELQLQDLVKVAGSMTVMYNRDCFLLASNETLGLETSVSVPAVRARRAGK